MKTFVNLILLLVGVALVVAGWILLFDSLPFDEASAKAVMLSSLLIVLGTLLIHPRTRRLTALFVLYSSV